MNARFLSRRTTPRSLLVTLVVALAMAGVIAVFKSRGGPSPSGPLQVALEPDNLDLGLVESQTTIEGEFLLKNLQDRAVTVRKVVTDCGCFVPEALVGAAVEKRGALVVPFRLSTQTSGKFERVMSLELQRGPERGIVNAKVTGVSLPESGFFVESGSLVELGILTPSEKREAGSHLAGRPEVLRQLTFAPDTTQITVSPRDVTEASDLGGLHRLALGIQVINDPLGPSAGRIAIRFGEEELGSIPVRWDAVATDKTAKTKRFLGVIAPGSEHEIALEAPSAEGAEPPSADGVQIVRVVSGEKPSVIVRFPGNKAGRHQAAVEYAGADGRRETIAVTAVLEEAY